MSGADELDSLAVEELLQEARRGKERSASMGTYGWKKKTMSTNKTFLKNTLRGVVSGNSHAVRPSDRRMRRERSPPANSSQSEGSHRLQSSSDDQQKSTKVVGSSKDRKESLDRNHRESFDDHTHRRSREQKYLHHRTKRTSDGYDRKRDLEESNSHYQSSRKDSKCRDSPEHKRVRDR